MKCQENKQESFTFSWISLWYAMKFIFRYPKILSTSCILVACTGLLTWGAMSLCLFFIDGYTISFFAQQPEVQHFWQWPLVWGWYALHWLYLIITRVIIFYFSFLLSYCCTSPGYVFLSMLAGNRYTQHASVGEAGFTLPGVLIDLWEGLKIGMVGVLVTFCALVVNFIPVIGQVAVLLIYVFYSTLMFIDFPASRYRWNLRQKIKWVFLYRNISFRLGLFPALISLIPILNIFLMALFFPLFTVHTTLNYLAIEKR